MKGQLIQVTDIGTHHLAKRPPPHYLCVFSNAEDANAHRDELRAAADHNQMEKVYHRVIQRTVCVDGAVFFLWVVTERVARQASRGGA